MRGTIHDPVDGQSRDVIAAKQAAPLQKFEHCRRQAAEERRAMRDKEGGRGGGYNDRQEVERRPDPTVTESDYDDFGRRIRRANPASTTDQKSCKSKTDRAAA